MSTNSHFPRPPRAAAASLAPGLLAGLFPAAVVICERRVPGDAADLLPEEARHVAKAVPKRIAEFAAGRACARAALRALGVVDFALLPAPDRQPQWPAGFVGSITHTTGYAAAAVAPQSSMLALGLDAEVIGAPTRDIWSTIARADERLWLESLPAGEQPAAVTLLFAAKEAFYKCQYPLVGEWLDFHDLRVRVSGWGGAEGTFLVDGARDLGLARHVALPLAGHYRFHELLVAAAVYAAHEGAGAGAAA